MLGIKHILFHKAFCRGSTINAYLMYWFLECHFQSCYLLFYLRWQLKKNLLVENLQCTLVYHYDVKVENKISVKILAYELCLVNCFISRLMTMHIPCSVLSILAFLAVKSIIFM